ncbi:MULTISPECIES: LCP family protein [unclassified Streptomyces]|uniref:LCP family protein n=1 Tax=unclassified Streptomyces TaxID=2593676 RepID=UPI001F039631|nr:MULTISPECIES: LCP family protein [unclassified Streptomyces]MCH0565454.1 LytR C-terminal domain-containing protein [Streptomyces sp. MUM 2J]MCH0568177.1 LytR C-terminal domain-containing protein [Streptomyces sp. MUM 136J]
MNDGYDAGQGGDQYELVGYDEYGQPVYRQVPPQQATHPAYDPHAQQGYGYDPYATGQQPPVPPYDPYGTGGHQQPTGHDPYGSPQQAPAGYDSYGTSPQGVVPGHDPYGTPQHPAAGHHGSYETGRQPAGEHALHGTPRQAADGSDPYGWSPAGGQQSRLAEQTAHIPQQAGPAGQEAPDGPAERDYHTEQFAFVEEPDRDSEDVIDWLKFTENRTERREEARRRARSRMIALLVALALVAVGGVGYLWYAGKLPGLSDSAAETGGTTAAGAQKRDVIVVHLHDTKKGGTATALLVDNSTTRQGTTVLLPNALALTADDGTTTTLAKSVDGDGSSGTREALDGVLGTDIQGTWRLDTPYLQNLVDLVGNIEVDADTDVPDPDAGKKGVPPVVRKGADRTLSGKTAVAYATYRASGESQNAQLQRFGQVMQGVLRKLSSDPQAATVTVQTLAQILDPSLTDKDLGTFLAKLADLAKGGDYKTALLPVQDDGTLNAKASDSVVKDVLGGTAKSPDRGSAVRVSVRDASGATGTTDKARVVLLNGGFTFLDAGTGTVRATSTVTYADAADKDGATEVAKTLGLPTGAVTRGKVSGNADVSVVLGQDYKPSSS